MVVQDYSAVSVSEQLWVRPNSKLISSGTCVVQSQLCVDFVWSLLPNLWVFGCLLAVCNATEMVDDCWKVADAGTFLSFLQLFAYSVLKGH